MFENIEPNEVSDIMDDYAVIDVRTPMEYSQSNIGDAINIDYLSPEWPAKIKELDKDKNYLLYCATGSRSTSACNELSELGFTSLTNLNGGMAKWARCGLS